MEEMAKQFTSIDLLGIFLPGSLVTLAVNTCLLNLTFPATNFFGDTSWILFVYFVILSYLFGHILNQMAVYLENLWKVPNMHAKYCGNKKIQEIYCRVFHKEHFPADENGQLEAGQDIFHYVQKGRRPQRILLFTAFYHMSRALVAACVVMLLPVLRYAWTQARETMLPATVLSVVFIFIFRRRWIYYEQKCVNEAYMIFLTGTDKEIPGV